MGKGLIKDALQLAGSQNKYQRMMIILLAMAWIAMMFVFLSSPFLYMDPLFHCQKSGDQAIKQKDACQIIRQKSDKCRVIDDFTMTAQIQLYCELQWARTLIQSSFPIGSFTGLMVMNLVSDTQGRKQAFLIAMLVTLAGIWSLLLGSYTRNIYILMVSQFMRGFGSESIYPLCYTLCADFLSDRLRLKAIVFLNSSGGVVSIVLGGFYLWGLDWLTFTMIFQLAPFVLVILAFFFYLQESPYILMDQNRTEQAREVLHYIAKFNSLQSNIPQINNLLNKQLANRKEQQLKQTTKKASIRNVIRIIMQWKYLKTIVILILINGISHMNYLGIAYCFSSVGLGYGYNSIVLGVVQSCSILFVSYIVTHVPRRTGISGFYALTMLVGMLYFIPYIDDNLLVSTLLIGVSRVFSVSANCLIGCLETQAFTVQIQSSAVGLIQGFGLYGAIIAPFLVSMAQHIAIHPMALIALFVSIAILPPFLLKQTFIKAKRQQVLIELQSNQIKQPLNQSYQKISVQTSQLS